MKTKFGIRPKDIQDHNFIEKLIESNKDNKN